MRQQIRPQSQLPTDLEKLVEAKDEEKYVSNQAKELLDEIKDSEKELYSLWDAVAASGPVKVPSPPDGQTPTESTDAIGNPDKAHQPSPTASPTAIPPPLGSHPKPPEETISIAAAAETADVPWSDAHLENYLKFLEDAQDELLQKQPILAHLGGDFDQRIAATTARFNSRRDESYYGNLKGEVAGLGRFAFTVPNKMHAFSIGIPRSAFIARSMSLAIQNGVLLGFSHNKPSEVEGFTTLPLTLAKKLAGVPHALFDAKNDSLQGQDTVIKSQTQLVADQQTLAKTVHPPATAAPTATPAAPAFIPVWPATAVPVPPSIH